MYFWFNNLDEHLITLLRFVTMDNDVLTAEDVMSHNLGQRMKMEKMLFNNSFEVKVTDFDEILANVTSVLEG